MSTAEPHLPSSNGQPAWEVAHFFPPQGHWSESDFFRIHTNRMAELVDGRLEILPMPTWLHQLIVVHFVERLREHLAVHKIDGVALLAPLPTRLFPRTIREPDVLYASAENVPEDPNGYPEKLDFVVEVVSSGADAHKRDYRDKPIDYAKAGIAEYWIVDPEIWKITVLGLHGESYEILGEYTAGQKAHGRYFEGFSIDVNDLIALGKRKESQA